MITLTKSIPYAVAQVESTTYPQIEGIMKFTGERWWWRA